LTEGTFTTLSSAKKKSKLVAEATPQTEAVILEPRKRVARKNGTAKMQDNQDDSRRAVPSRREKEMNQKTNQSPRKNLGLFFVVGFDLGGGV